VHILRHPEPCHVSDVFALWEAFGGGGAPCPGSCGPNDGLPQVSQDPSRWQQILRILWRAVDRPCIETSVATARAARRPRSVAQSGGTHVVADSNAPCPAVEARGTARSVSQTRHARAETLCSASGRRACPGYCQAAASCAGFTGHLQKPATCSKRSAQDRSQLFRGEAGRLARKERDGEK
jgi:hypothetical protein